MIPEITETRLPHHNLQAKREFWPVIVTLTTLYVIAVAIGNRRYVWFDELFTLNIARAPSLIQLWQRELRFDNHTPTAYLLSRGSMAIFGQTPLGLRLPTMVEFYFGSIAILLYVRRKAGTPFAVLAVLLLWAVAPTLHYAVEARSYGLIFLSFSYLLLSWDTAIRSQPRRLALFGVGGSTLLLLLSHMFAVFSLLGFVAAETVRSLRRRKLDGPLWLSLILPMFGMLIYIPLVRASRNIVFATNAGLHTTMLFFEGTLGAAIIPVVLLVLLLTPPTRRSKTSGTTFSPEEIALLICLLLNPIFLNLVLMYRQGIFYDRYCLTTQVAIVVALVILLPYRIRLNRWAAYGASLVVVVFLIKTQIWDVLRYPSPRNAAFLESIDPSLPIVAGEGQVFAEMNNYEDPVVLSRLYYLKDRQASLQFSHTNFFQDFEAPDEMKAAGFPYRANIEPYEEFVHRHRQFLLLSRPDRWVFVKLLSEGASITFLGDYKNAMPYLDSTLYVVRVP